LFGKNREKDFVPTCSLVQQFDIDHDSLAPKNVVSSFRLQGKAVWLRDSLIAMRSVGAAIAQKMIVVVLVARTIPRTSPGYLHCRAGLKPSVMELSTQAMIDIVLMVQMTQPWFLTDGKMNQTNVFYGPGPTIFTIFLLRQAFSNGILVLITMVTTWGTHIVPYAPIQFQRPAWIENLKVIGHETLKGHGY
jgi:hypothetical protein